MKSTLYKKIVVEQYGLTNELSLSDVYTKAKNAKNSIKKYFTENPTKAKLLTGQALLSLTVSIVKLMQGGTPDEEDIQNIIQKKVEALNTAQVPSGQAITSVDNISDKEIVVNVQTQDPITDPEILPPNDGEIDQNTSSNEEPTDNNQTNKSEIEQKVEDFKATAKEIADNINKENGVMRYFYSISKSSTSENVSESELRNELVNSYKNAGFHGTGKDVFNMRNDEITRSNLAIGGFQKLINAGILNNGESLNVESVIDKELSSWQYTGNTENPDIDTMNKMSIENLSKSEFTEHVKISDPSGKLLYEFTLKSVTNPNSDGAHYTIISDVKFHVENLMLTDEEAESLASGLVDVASSKKVGIEVTNLSGIDSKTTTKGFTDLNEEIDKKIFDKALLPIKNAILADSKKQVDAAIASMSDKSKNSLVAKLAYIVYKKKQKKIT